MKQSLLPLATLIGIYIIPLENGCSFLLSEVLSDGNDSLETNVSGKGFSYYTLCRTVIPGEWGAWKYSSFLDLGGN